MHVEKEGKDELYCNLGHLLLRDGKLVCSHAGHSETDCEIDLAELVAKALSQGQLNFQQVVYILQKRITAPGLGRVTDVRPPRHKAKLVATLEHLETPVAVNFTKDEKAWVITELIVRNKGLLLDDGNKHAECRHWIEGLARITEQELRERIPTLSWPGSIRHSEDRPDIWETKETTDGQVVVVVRGSAGPAWDFLAAVYVDAGDWNLHYIARRGQKFYHVTVQLRKR